MTSRSNIVIRYILLSAHREGSKRNIQRHQALGSMLRKGKHTHAIADCRGVWHGIPELSYCIAVGASPLSKWSGWLSNILHHWGQEALLICATDGTGYLLDRQGNIIEVGDVQHEHFAYEVEGKDHTRILSRSTAFTNVLPALPPYIHVVDR